MEKKKTTAERIAEIKKQIVNCKDARQSEKLLNQLLGLHRSTFEMNRLLDIPLSDIKDEIDFGANVLYKVRDGYVWECKGGMTIHVSVRMARVCAMLNTLFEMYQTQESQTEAGRTLYESFSTAVAYIFQAPIFSSLDERALFQNATAILNSFNEYCNEKYTNAEAPERAEQDYLDDAQEELLEKGVETLVNTPLPLEDIHD